MLCSWQQKSKKISFEPFHAYYPLALLTYEGKITANINNTKSNSHQLVEVTASLEIKMESRIRTKKVRKTFPCQFYNSMDPTLIAFGLRF